MRGLKEYAIEVDEEELEMLIDFQRSAAADAEESCEHDEAAKRRQRAKELQGFKKKVAANA